MNTVEPVAPLTADAFAVMFDAMPTAAVCCRVIFDGDEPVDIIHLYSNASFKSMSGLQVEFGTPLSKAFKYGYATDRGFLERHARVARSGQPESYERYNPNFGEWVTTTLYSPAPDHFISIIGVITAQKEAAAAAARSDSRMRATLEASPVPLCFNDSLGRITYLNPAFVRTFGYTTADIPELPRWWEAAYPDPNYRQWVIATWQKHMEESARDGTPFRELEVNICCKDGKIRTVLAAAAEMGESSDDTHLVSLYDITDLVKARQSLEEAHRYAELIINSVGEGLSQMDDTGMVTFINPVGAALLGYAQHEIIGKNGHALFHHSHNDGSSYPVAECPIQNALNNAAAFTSDNEVFWRKDGSFFHVQYVSSPMVVNGSIQGTVVTFRDVTEENRNKRTLIENEVKIRKAQEIAGFGSYSTDLTTGKWESSAVLDSIFGIDDSFDHNIPNWNSLLAPEFQQLALNHYMEVAAGKCDFRLDYQIIRPVDGVRRWVAANGELEFDSAGTPIRLIGTIQDIHERKQIEEQLKQSHDLLKKLSEQVPGILYKFKMDNEGKFSAPFVSRGAIDIFGYTAEELEKDVSLIYSRMPAGNQESFNDQIFESARTLKNWESEFRVEMPGLGTQWRQGQARPEVQPDGSILWFGFIFDVTERVETKNQLAQLNETLESRVAQRTGELEVALVNAEAAKRSRGEFLAKMSHEIRTPMNTILGMAYLARKNSTGHRAHQQLSKIETAATHLLGIIDDILDISKIDAGKLQIEGSDFEIAPWVQEIIQLIEGKAHEKALQLHLDIGPEIPPVLHGDMLRMSQVLINYLNNAIKFTSQGSITLRLRCSAIATRLQAQEHCLLRVEVQDSGIGLDDEQISRLFQSFEQGDNSTTRKYGGTGLGLAISKQLAQLMGGEVGVSSTPGVGSTFWFTALLKIPQTEHITTPMTEIPTDTALLRGKRILVVDDNEFNLDVAQGILEEEGMQVMLAGNGAEAIERLRQYSFDCVLMDVQMPVMDGLEATRRIRADPALASTLVIASTANARNEDRAQCLEAGMDDVVTKPINPALLFATMLQGMIAPTRPRPKAAPTRPKEESTATPLWDIEVLVRTIGSNPETHLRLLAKFLVGAREQSAEIAQAIQQARYTEAAEAAHKLKSSARAVGAIQLGIHCAAMESAGLAGQALVCATISTDLLKSFVETERAIVQFTSR